MKKTLIIFVLVFIVNNAFAKRGTYPLCSFSNFEDFVKVPSFLVRGSSSGIDEVCLGFQKSSDGSVYEGYFKGEVFFFPYMSHSPEFSDVCHTTQFSPMYVEQPRIL